MTYTQKDIFEIIKNYLYAQHYDKIKTGYEIQPSSNWYGDLNLDSFDRLSFYVWVEEKFAIKLPALYFTTVGELSNEIYNRLLENYRQQVPQQPTLLQRVKQMFTRQK